MAAWKELRTAKLKAASRRWAVAGDGAGEGVGEALEWGAAELIDDLVEAATKEEDAMCVVCGGGVSESPNEILFCERCDLAVHQARSTRPSSAPSGRQLCSALLCSALLALQSRLLRH